MTSGVMATVDVAVFILYGVVVYVRWLVGVWKLLHDWFVLLLHDVFVVFVLQVLFCILVELVASWEYFGLQ